MTVYSHPYLRSRFVLDVNGSRFVDFQKVRVQEIQSELPRGCIPRTLEIILRAEAVESAQPGDRYGKTQNLSNRMPQKSFKSVCNQGRCRWITKDDIPSLSHGSH